MLVKETDRQCQQMIKHLLTQNLRSTRRNAYQQCLGDIAQYGASRHQHQHPPAVIEDFGEIHGLVDTDRINCITRIPGNQQTQIVSGNRCNQCQYNKPLVSGEILQQTDDRSLCILFLNLFSQREHLPSVIHR